MAIIKQDVNKWRKYTTYRKKLFEVCFILALFPEKWGHFVTDSPRTYHHSAVNLKLTTFPSLVLSNFNEEITNELSTRHWLSAAKAPEIVHWIGTSFLISWGPCDLHIAAIIITYNKATPVSFSKSFNFKLSWLKWVNYKAFEGRSNPRHNQFISA